MQCPMSVRLKAGFQTLLLFLKLAPSVGKLLIKGICLIEIRQDLLDFVGSVLRIESSGSYYILKLGNFLLCFLYFSGELRELALLLVGELFLPPGLLLP